MIYRWIQTLLQAPMRIRLLLRVLLQMYPSVSTCIDRTNLLLPLLVKQNRHLIFDFSRVFHNRCNYITKETISSVLHAMLSLNWDLICNNKKISGERKSKERRLCFTTLPASGSSLRPLLNVEASVDEQDSSYSAVRPSLIAELIEIVHIEAAYPSQLQSSFAPPSPLAHT